MHNFSLNVTLLALSMLASNCRGRWQNNVDIDHLMEINSVPENGLNLAFDASDVDYQQQMIRKGREVIARLVEIKSSNGAEKLIVGREDRHVIELVRQLGVEDFFGTQIGPRIRPKPLPGTKTINPKQDLMAAVNAILWAQYADKNVDAKSIAFSIKDNGAVFDFLSLYRDFVKDKGMSYARDPNKRGSSHLRNIKGDNGKMPMQWGLDFRAFKDGDLLELLPDEKTHVLFGQFQINPKDPGAIRTYIKTETIGIGTTSDQIRHGLNFLKKSTGSANYRGEEIGPQVKALLIDYFESNNVDETELKNILKRKPLFQIIGEIKGSDSKKAELLTSLERLYEGDNFDIESRLGSEVQIDYTHLKNSSERALYIGSAAVWKKNDAPQEELAGILEKEPEKPSVKGTSKAPEVDIEPSPNKNLKFSMPPEVGHTKVDDALPKKVGQGQGASMVKGKASKKLNRSVSGVFVKILLEGL